jgi:type I restriction enzyme S subunit
MKSEWMTKQLSEIVNFNPSESLPKGTKAKKISMDMLQPYCRDVPIFEVTAYTGGTKFRNGDTIMARITPCLENGKTAQINILGNNEVGFGSTEYIVFRAKEDVSVPDYIYYLVRSPFVREPAIKSMVGSSGRQRVQTDVVMRLEVQVPPLEEQQKIAGILRVLDDKIKLNNEINKNLFQQAQAMYKSRFIDFEPFDCTMPDSWNLGTVSEIIELHDSKRIPLSSRERADLDKAYPYYGATSVMDYVDRYLFDGIYLLLGEDGTVVDDKGYPILQYVEGKFWVNNHAHILTGKNGFSVELLYLLFSLTSVKAIVTGAVQPKISQANLNKVPVVIPSADELRQFDDCIQPIFAEIRNLRNENTKLNDLRDGLLPKLMTGELDVSSIDL